MAKLSSPFIVISGDDDFSQDRYIAYRKTAWKKRHITLRDGADMSEVDLVNLCETEPIFDEGQGRVIFLDNAQELKCGKVWSEYVDKRNPANLSNLFLAIVRDAKMPACWSSLAKKGTSVAFMKPRPWESKKILDGIDDEAEGLKLKLDLGVADLIYRLLGNNLRSVVNELTKVSYLVGPDRLVRKEHVVKVMVSSVEIEPHQVMEAAFGKNKKLAQNRLSKLFKLSGDPVCIPIVVSGLHQVEKLLIARQILDQDGSVADVAIRLGIHEYVCKINIVPTAQKHTAKALLGHMNNLCKLDFQIKGAARSKRTLEELAVLAIAA